MDSIRNFKPIREVGKNLKNISNPLINVVQDVIKLRSAKPLEDIDAAQCGVWSSNVIKTQDIQNNEKSYEKIYKYLDDDKKTIFDSFSQEDKDTISEIFKNNFCNFKVVNSNGFDSDEDSSSDEEDFEYDIQNSTILNNLIEIFHNNAYSDLKNYYTKNVNNYNSLKLRILKNYQVSDVNNYLSKANLSLQDFFAGDLNFVQIMSTIEKTKFESEEIKEQVKENLFELSNSKNSKRKSLSERDIKAIIKFLTDKNGIMEKMEILKQLNLFSNYCYYLGYNVKDKLEVFNTFVDLIPENESFVDYKDKIIDCVNNLLKESDAHNFLENILRPNINTIKENDYKTLLDRMIKCPYKDNGEDNLYCHLMFGNDIRYANTSASILNLIISYGDYHYDYNLTTFDKLYNQYMPMFQRADEDTLKNINCTQFSRLCNLYDFLNNIPDGIEEVSLGSLNFQQLKELQLLLLKNNYNQIFQNMDISFISEKVDKLFVKNDNIIDFDATVYEINRLLNAKHVALSQTQKEHIDNILSVKEGLAQIDFEKVTIKKTNNFEILKQDIKNILSEDGSLSDKDKRNILSRLTDDITSMMFAQLPGELDNYDVVKNIRAKIGEYLSFKKVENEENAYIIGDVKVSGIDDNAKTTLEHIFKAIPELVILLGKKQVGHNFDLGKHILAVGKEVVKNDKFQNLSENNQKLVLIAALMHDISKMEDKRDFSHPERGGRYAYNMLNGALLNQDDKTTVANLIFNNHFGEYIAKNGEDEIKMYTLAYECKDENPQFLNMLRILGEADLNGDDESYKLDKSEYCAQIPDRIGTLTKQIQTINGLLGKLKESLQLTPFPQKTIDMTSELQDNSIMQECKEDEIIGEFEKEGCKIPKIDLTKMKYVSIDKQKKYLEFLGFKNTTYGSLEFLIHAIKGGKQVGGIDYLTSQFKSDATLSTSIITMANTRTFQNRKYGFIMEPNKTKILSAATGNISSGCGKGRNLSGKYISKTQDMDNKELSYYISNSKLFAQEEHSELITVDNEVAAIFVKEGCENEIPKELVQYAKKRNLPLIVVPMIKVDDNEQV